MTVNRIPWNRTGSREHAKARLKTQAVKLAATIKKRRATAQRTFSAVQKNIKS